MNKKVVIAIIVGVVGLLVLACCVGMFLISRQASKDAEAMKEKFGPLLTVCDGGGFDGAAAYIPGSGVHLTMGVGPGYTDSWRFDKHLVPTEAQPEALAETELVLCVKEQEKVLVESCEYFAMDDEKEEGVPAIIERYSYEREVTLIEAKTGEVVAREVLRGTEPDECPEEAKFSDEGETKTESGGSVSDEDVTEWVRSYVVVP